MTYYCLGKWTKWNISGTEALWEILCARKHLAIFSSAGKTLSYFFVCFTENNHLALHKCLTVHHCFNKRCALRQKAKGKLQHKSLSSWGQASEGNNRCQGWSRGWWRDSHRSAQRREQLQWHWGEPWSREARPLQHDQTDLQHRTENQSQWVEEELDKTGQEHKPKREFVQVQKLHQGQERHNRQYLLQSDSSPAWQYQDEGQPEAVQQQMELELGDETLPHQRLEMFPMVKQKKARNSIWEPPDGARMYNWAPLWIFPTFYYHISSLEVHVADSDHSS